MNAEEAEEYTQIAERSTDSAWRLNVLAERLGVPTALGITTREWVQRIGGYVRLTIPERREAVLELTAEGMSTRKIADVLGVDAETARRDRTAANAAAEAPPTPEPDRQPAANAAAPPPPPREPTAEDLERERRHQERERRRHLTHSFLGSIVMLHEQSRHDPAATFLRDHYDHAWAEIDGRVEFLGSDVAGALRAMGNWLVDLANEVDDGGSL